jgi:uncharacterized membrane protein SirB2
MISLSNCYPIILRLHIGCVAMSGTLFATRGTLRLLRKPLANHIVLRRLSYIIDSCLLGAAVLLMLVLHQYPFRNDWLSVKLALVVIYIFFGTLTMKRARTLGGQCAAFAAALLTFVSIISVAMTHDAAGWLSH